MRHDEDDVKSCAGKGWSTTTLDYPYKWSFNFSVSNVGIMIRIWRGNYKYTWTSAHPFMIEKGYGIYGN